MNDIKAQMYEQTLAELRRENVQLREFIKGNRKIKDVLARKYRTKKAENAQLRKALVYYADKKRYEPYAIIEVNPCDITEDGGHVAREAIKQSQL